MTTLCVCGSECSQSIWSWISSVVPASVKSPAWINTVGKRKHHLGKSSPWDAPTVTLGYRLFETMCVGDAHDPYSPLTRSRMASNVHKQAVGRARNPSHGVGKEAPEKRWRFPCVLRWGQAEHIVSEYMSRLRKEDSATAQLEAGESVAIVHSQRVPKFRRWERRKQMTYARGCQCFDTSALPGFPRVFPPPQGLHYP